MLEKTFACLAAAILLTGCQQETPPVERPANTSVEAANDLLDGKHATFGQSVGPEAVLRSFMVAMIEQDREQLAATALPNDDLELLLSNEPLPPGAAEQFAAIKFRRLKVGEEFTFPAGNTITLDETQINDESVLLTSKDAPLPFKLVKVEGQWKVDADMIIATRKVAEELRKQQGN